MVLGDIAIYLLAGIFALLGLMWEPAWAIALAIVAFIIVRRSAGQAHYECTQCKREFTQKQLYVGKP